MLRGCNSHSKPARRLAIFNQYLDTFANHASLQQRVLKVLQALPANVRDDFLQDSRFSIALDDYKPGAGSTVWMASPGADDSSRSIILKPKLNDCAEDFALYVIAHEFAHAFLRNGGWGDITDPEAAADALAAKWGFARPTTWFWR